MSRRTDTAEHAAWPRPPARPRTTCSAPTPGTSGGPYLSERAWGTVREDYSDDGDAWGSFPHDHARSRAYRWNEDGMAGISDIHHELCLALALWNGADPILKERMFGLTGPAGQPRRGRQGVLVVPRRAAQPRLAALALPLPAGRVPLRAGWSRRTAGAGEDDPEFELLDTGVFDDGRYWVRRGHLRQGLAHRGAGPDHDREPRARGGPAARAADACGSATPGGWRRRGPAGALAPRRRRRDRRGPPPAGRLPAAGRRRRPTAPRPRRCSATTRPTPPGSSARPRSRRSPRTGSTTTSSPGRRR